MAHQTHITADAPSGFINFMRSFPGRALRVAAGLVLVYLGFFVVGGTAGTILGIVGFLPFAAGLANFCLLGPVFHVDLRGHPKRHPG